MRPAPKTTLHREGELPELALRNTPHGGMDVFGFCLNLTKVDQTPPVAKGLGWVRGGGETQM